MNLTRSILKPTVLMLILLLLSPHSTSVVQSTSELNQDIVSHSTDGNISSIQHNTLTWNSINLMNEVIYSDSNVVMYLSDWTDNGGLLLRTVQMYSNQQTMGNLEVSNTGQNIDWDTQVLTANMKGPSPPSSAIVMTVSRSSQAVFIVNWDHTDNYIPACDNGFNYDVEFEFILENPNDSGRSQTVSRTVIDDKNGGFCTSPSPPEPAVTDPELQIVIQPPSTTISQEYFRSYGSVMLNVHEQNAYYDQNGQGIGWQVVDSRHDQAFGPSCTVYGSCYQLIIINWV